MNQLSKIKIRFVFVFCFSLFLLNGLWLAILQRSDRSQLHSSPFYETYLNLRSLLLRPLSLVMILAFAAGGLHWVFKPRKEPIGELERLVAFAMVLGLVFGIILMAGFKL